MTMSITRAETIPDTGLLRNAELTHLAELLQDQQTRKLDVIVAPHTARSLGGRLVIDGTEPVLSESGATSTAGTYQNNPVALEGIAAKLDIPPRYLKRIL